MLYPNEFKELLENFQKLPGVGEKSAERYVYAINNLSFEDVEKFSYSLIDFKKNIKKCSICGHLTNSEVCSICSDSSRDKSIICVVDDSKSVFMFEKTGKFNGLYHVLGGLISPIDDVNPEDINIDSLVNKRISSEVSEVILSLTPSVEGEMTSLYIKKLLEKKKVKVSRLSYGLPVNADFEYLDPLTIIRAIDDRKPLE